MVIITRSGRIIPGTLVLAVALAIPATAAAQSSTFVLPFDRLGPPTQNCTTQPDGTITCVAAGAFQDPCTGQNVDVTGSTTLTISTNVTGSGSMKLSVSEVTKGTGTGWDPLEPYLLGVNPDPLTANTYSFAESQKFDTQFTLSGDPTTITSSTFSDKLFMKGSKSLNNWTIKATFTIKINGNGVVTSVNNNFTGDVCKG